MKKRIQGAALALFFAAFFCILFGWWKFKDVPEEKRYIDHIENRDANPRIGLSEIPESGYVDETFESHLPLIILDTGGVEIPNYKKYHVETDAFEEPDGVDPYIDFKLTVVDRENHVNRISDGGTIVSDGKIKIRGNSSSQPGLPKHQYKLKLLNGEGEETPLDLLDMGAESEWILNPSVRDASYIRNYLAFNVAGKVEPYQPDVRFCEVLFREGSSYRYGGLYMMFEPIEASPNRVNIRKDASKYDVGSGYLLKKDRFDKDTNTLYTWGTDQGFYTIMGDDGITENRSYFMVEYPSKKRMTPELLAQITEEINMIEHLLYDEPSVDLNRLEQYLEIDTFVDFFIINEFLASYDSGMHSTFFYKDAVGKLNIGPYWDYDGAMDNSMSSLTSVDFMVMPYRPWFSKLVTSEEFVRKVEKRYRSLRKDFLSDKQLEQFIDDAQAYLGNAVSRDRSVFGDYFYDLRAVEEEKTGLSVDRRRYTPEEETQRIKDFLYSHGEYMDLNIESLYSFVVQEKGDPMDSLLATAFLLLFIAATVVSYRYVQMN